jgi:hypothetical protein
VNVCYCDESGTGNEPIAVMTGILVDAGRMHRTKEHWEGLLQHLSEMVGRQIAELHTRDFYAGNGPFRGIDGPTRSNIVSAIFQWIAERKHHVVYTSVWKEAYRQAFEARGIPDELNTIWRFMGFHLVLALQKYCKGERGVKGHTILIFDNEERERMRFTDLIARPPAWSDAAYYNRKKKEDQLDQIVDVPYFGDSQEVALIQLADFLAFFVRRYAEIKEGLVGPSYSGEETKIDGWMEMLMQRSIGNRFIYPARSRGDAENLFYNMAPRATRELRG